MKGCKYILLKRAEICKKQNQKLENLKEALRAMMHNLKEAFTKIFDESKNCYEGMIKLIDWLKTHWFPKTVKTIKNWFGEIIGY